MELLSIEMRQLLEPLPLTPAFGFVMAFTVAPAVIAHTGEVPLLQPVRQRPVVPAQPLLLIPHEPVIDDPDPAVDLPFGIMPSAYPLYFRGFTFDTSTPTPMQGPPAPALRSMALPSQYQGNNAGKHYLGLVVFRTLIVYR
jgi:hypothetical protein